MSGEKITQQIYISGEEDMKIYNKILKAAEKDGRSNSSFMWNLVKAAFAKHKS